MAKTIKFNLICDEKPIRTIEDLQNNFSIEDVLAYYNNQLLHRWLRVRGYDKELDAVSAITSSEPMDIIKELIRIFDVTADPEKVEESIYMLKYLEERKELCAIYEQENYDAKHIIDDYEVGYRQLVDGILSNPNDAAIIKANIAEIVSNYAWILELNHRELFWELTEHSVLAIMCLLMNEGSRNYYLPIKEDSAVTLDTNDDPKREKEKIVLDKAFACDPSAAKFDTDSNSDKADMFAKICHIIGQADFEDILGENLVVFSGQTDGYWKDLEPKGKRYMIIRMGEGDYVRSAGQSGGDLSSAAIQNNFVIVDGVDYKSNSSVRKLLYMEV